LVIQNAIRRKEAKKSVEENRAVVQQVRLCIDTTAFWDRFIHSRTYSRKTKKKAHWWFRVPYGGRRGRESLRRRSNRFILCVQDSIIGVRNHIGLRHHFHTNSRILRSCCNGGAAISLKTKKKLQYWYSVSLGDECHRSNLRLLRCIPLGIITSREGWMSSLIYDCLSSCCPRFASHLVKQCCFRPYVIHIERTRRSTLKATWHNKYNSTFLNPQVCLPLLLDVFCRNFFGCI
jgi:hypothetical protein